jgi:glucose/arabinose dehydrogenase
MLFLHPVLTVLRRPLRREVLGVALAAAIALALVLPGAPAAHAARTTFASGVPFATNLAFDPTGGVWVTSSGGGPEPSDGVWYVRRAGAKPLHVVRGLHAALGLTWFGGELFVSHATSPSKGRISALSGFDGTRFKHRRTAVARLAIGRHSVDSIVPGPDGRLYAGVGSTEDNKGRQGRVVSFAPSGHGLRLEAGGLRNPYGLAFVPGTSTLLVTDNGRDDLGLRRPPDELDAFDVMAPRPDFGFPHCFDQGGSPCRGKRAALLHFAPHASSDGLAVTADWGGAGLTAFVAENGSSFRANPTGDDIQRVTLTDRGGGRFSATRTTFAKNFALNNPLGAAIGPDGALYVTLFAAGKVLRYTP